MKRTRLERKDLPDAASVYFPSSYFCSEIR